VQHGDRLTEIVAIVAGTLLPYLNARDRRLLKPTNHKHVSEIDEDDSEEEEEDVEMDKIREMVREWKAEAARHGRPLKLPTSKHSFLRLNLDSLPVPFMLRNIWTAGLVLFGLIMGSTFFITKVWQVSPMSSLELKLGDRGDCASWYLLGHRRLGVS
jgi:solute carrier family 45 protein 1/2/4